MSGMDVGIGSMSIDGMLLLYTFFSPVMERQRDIVSELWQSQGIITRKNVLIHISSDIIFIQLHYIYQPQKLQNKLQIYQKYKISIDKFGQIMMQNQIQKVQHINIKNSIVTYIMGGCVVGTKDTTKQTLTRAYDTFNKLDTRKNGQINQADIKKHFQSYAETSAKVMLREIDLNKDGIITMNQWLGYWEMVRRSGYKPAVILKQLNNIDEGNLTLNFPQVHQYQKQLPRTTVVNSILDDLRRSPPQDLPFSIEK